jgi:K+-transporting ATPase A subunit
VLLPLARILGLVLVWRGVPLNLNPYVEVTTVEGKTQVIALGPDAGLEPIKNLGTGGGFFNTNGVPPCANPTPRTGRHTYAKSSGGIDRPPPAAASSDWVMSGIPGV